MNLNGKSFSIPFGALRKSYCSKCGEKLKTERTHRVVTKDDKDYYRYHDIGRFPQRDYDVYDYRYMCPSCQARISFEEQRIIRKIQKRNNKRVLSSYEMKNDYEECKAKCSRNALITSIITSIVIAFIFSALLYFSENLPKTNKIFIVLGIFVSLSVFLVLGAVKRYKGTYKLKIKSGFSYEKEAQLKKLHTYSSHNKNLIDVSEKCYCFYCKSVVDAKEITEFLDNGQTAKCPKCKIDAIIPDAIDEEINESTINEMNEYWF